MIRNLFLAYAATWVIHLGYLRFLAAKYSQLAREERELEKE
jgi:CcmD family protein